MKSRLVRLAASTTGKVRVGWSLPSLNENSNTAACDPPPTYTRLPLGVNANPSQPSGTGVRLTSLAPATSSTLIEGGL